MNLVRIVAINASLLLLGGCYSLAGVGGVNTYSCKAPAGVTCKSISGVYANSTEGATTDVRPKEGDEASGRGISVNPDSHAGAARAMTVSAATAETGVPIVRPARVLRMWVAPWRDREQDIHDEVRVYMQVDHGDFLMDPMLKRIGAEYAPARASAKPASYDAP